MQVVGLHQTAVFGDAGEKIRDEGYPLGGGDLPEHGLKAVGVSRTVVGWQADASHQDLAAGSAGQVDHGGEIVADDAEAKTPQAIVSPQLEQNQAGSVLRQETGQSGATPGGGLAGNAGIDDPHGAAHFLQSLFEQFYPTVLMVNTIGGTQTIAKDQDERGTG